MTPLSSLGLNSDKQQHIRELLISLEQDAGYSDERGKRNAFQKMQRCFPPFNTRSDAFSDYAIELKLEFERLLELGQRSDCSYELLEQYSERFLVKIAFLKQCLAKVSQSFGKNTSDWQQHLQSLQYSDDREAIYKALAKQKHYEAQLKQKITKAETIEAQSANQHALQLRLQRCQNSTTALRQRLDLLKHKN
ncbi:hypothetical protein DBZ36_03595 [Alginatibacterium sediminis]|uniref:Uncharacterized protein n=1 Tax=Alginatibacterium sediminis TaxID=2164068 RepID=A0A420EFW9_9ALTE|nr:primosomal replication protein PriC [Alginatibacterium sediminis]RKF19560.1 hypothetical protein DBZ36_03595 [Alginatibacterium sediminis]